MIFRTSVVTNGALPIGIAVVLKLSASWFFLVGQGQIVRFHDGSIDQPQSDANSTDQNFDVVRMLEIVTLNVRMRQWIVAFKI